MGKKKSRLLHLTDFGDLRGVLSFPPCEPPAPFYPWQGSKALQQPHRLKNRFFQCLCPACYTQQSYGKIHSS